MQEQKTCFLQRLYSGMVAALIFSIPVSFVQRLGDDFAPLLAPLSASQAKLVSIYVQRAASTRSSS